MWEFNFKFGKAFVYVFSAASVALSSLLGYCQKYPLEHVKVAIAQSLVFGLKVL